MIDSLISLIRYSFILLLFLFLFKIVRLMVIDLRSLTRSGKIASKAKSVRMEEPDPLVEYKESRSPVELVVLEGNNQLYHVGQALQLRKNVTIGRGVDNNIVITGQKISNHHARIWEERSQWWIEDLGSKNGTFINDILIKKPISLANGDKIGMGEFVFRFVRWNYEVQ